MTPAPLADPAALELLAAVDQVRAQLDDIADRLRRVLPRTDELVAATDWQTEAARRFHHAAAAWRQDIDVLAAVAEESCEDARWLSARVGAMVWSGLP